MFLIPESQAIYAYTYSGPFYEDGTAANADVNVTVLYSNATSYTFTLSGNGTDTTNTTLYSSMVPTQAFWNASTALNYTRVYDFKYTTNSTVTIHIPMPNAIAYPYTFVVSDFYGMDNPYLRTSIGYHIYEYRKLSSGTVAFIMEQYRTYTLTVICDQGSYTQTFTPESTFSTNLQVLSGAFPTAAQYNDVAVNANRTNSTMVTVTYVDNQALTDWTYLTIHHYVGATDVVDYTTNTTGNSQTWNWYSADNLTDYHITLDAMRNGAALQWKLIAPLSSALANPFSGLISSLGTFPASLANPDEIPWLLIVLAVLAVFSYFSASIGIVLSVVVAAVFTLFGWLTIPLPTLGFAGFVGVLNHLAESKKTEREL